MQVEDKPTGCLEYPAFWHTRNVLQLNLEVPVSNTILSTGYPD